MYTLRGGSDCDPLYDVPGGVNPLNALEIPDYGKICDDLSLTNQRLVGISRYGRSDDVAGVGAGRTWSRIFWRADDSNIKSENGGIGSYRPGFPSWQGDDCHNVTVKYA